MSSNGKGAMNKPNVRVRREDVTPAMAERLLKANQRNRHLRSSRVAQLAGAMRRGEWELNGETVKVATGGDLLDGQHRLAAVMASGVTVPMVVVRGLPSQVQATVDTGAARTVGDMLRLQGEKDCFVLAAATRRVWSYRELSTFADVPSMRPTPQQLLATLEEHPKLRSSVRFAGRLHTQVRIPKGPFTALHYLFSLADPVDANTWFEMAGSGDGLLHDDPRSLWRNQTMRWLQSPRHPSQVQLTAWAVKSWNLWRSGERLAQIQWHPQRGEKFPLIDGLTLDGKRSLTPDAEAVQEAVKAGVS